MGEPCENERVKQPHNLCGEVDGEGVVELGVKAAKHALRHRCLAGAHRPDEQHRVMGTRQRLGEVGVANRVHRRYYELVERQAAATQNHEELLHALSVL